ncbi:GTP cyclohydrolase FolE2 [uncultured Mailhella sp.]|uniref:GTP cyclohydrolase FolE2 n=1 Tax=uncultured Mailhella sp. TaxID=1981031 RepID=UPI00261CC2CE|nr:GTP cyclohydrolase FolE2 [uncultured Mailhella sp.]
MSLSSGKPLQDVQSAPADVALAIDCVGVKHIELPLVVKDRDRGSQHTVASVDMGVDLPAAYKGTHMSRFIEALEHWRKDSGEMLDYPSLKRLLGDVLQRLHAHRAYASFHFPYFLTRRAPVSGQEAPVRYTCRLTGEMEEGEKRPHILLELEIPVTTVCPCSKAISCAGAHGQRATVRLAVRMARFEWLEGFIDIAEASGSSPIYTLLKRPDEKFVTEHAYENAVFVEDVVRNVAVRLESQTHVTWFRVEVESEESIHGHNACACIERTIDRN